MSCSSASHTTPRCSRSVASPLSNLKPRVSPGSSSVSLKSLPFVMRNGWTYFSMRSMISFLGIAQDPFFGEIQTGAVRRQHVLDRISGVRKGGFLAHRSQSRSEDETEIRDGKDALRTNHQRHSAGDAEALFG